MSKRSTKPLPKQFARTVRRATRAAQPSLPKSGSAPAKTLTAKTLPAKTLKTRVKKPVAGAAVRAAFLKRSTSAFERMSQHLSEGQMLAALAAPTDIGALARALADATVADATTRELDPFGASLARNALHREELIDLSGSLISAPKAALMLGVTRQAIDKRRTSKRLLGVKIAGDWAYPAFQFDDRLPPDALKSVLEILDDPGGWIALDFLLTSDSVLGNKTPAETMSLGAEAAARVLRLARAERSDGFS